MNHCKKFKDNEERSIQTLLSRYTIYHMEKKCALIELVFTFFQKKGRVGIIKKGTFVRQKGTLVR